MLNQIDHDCEIGEGTKVWQFASVIRGATVGRFCIVGACAIIDGASVGDRCSIGHAASIHPGARIGSDVLIGPSAVICNDRWPSVEKTGWDLAAIRQFSTVIIEDGASIGANATILPGVRIGAGALVAAGSVVTRDVPTYQVFRCGQVEDKPANWRDRRMRLLA